jgi:hypothetical protein
MLNKSDAKNEPEFLLRVPATEEKFRNVTLKKPRDWAELDLNRSLVSHPSTGPGTAVQP